MPLRYSKYHMVYTSIVAKTHEFKTKTLRVPYQACPISMQNATHLAPSNKASNPVLLLDKFQASRSSISLAFSSSSRA